MLIYAGHQVSLLPCDGKRMSPQVRLHLLDGELAEGALISHALQSTRFLIVDPDIWAHASVSLLAELPSSVRLLAVLHVCCQTRHHVVETWGLKPSQTRQYEPETSPFHAHAQSCCL